MNDEIQTYANKPIGTGQPAHNVAVTFAGVKRMREMRELLVLMRDVMGRIADDEDMPENWEGNLNALLQIFDKALQPAPLVKVGDFVRRHGADEWFRVTAVHDGGVRSLPDLVTNGDSDPTCVTQFAEHYPTS